MRKSSAIVHTDIPFRLDRLPWSRFHLLVVIGLGVTWILDGLEVTIVGSLGPALQSAATLRLSSSDIGVVAGFLQVGERLMIRTRLTDRPAALLTFDLDRFKSINDKFGHPAGDTVLVTFCRLATSKLRPTDLFGRMGGEEFASLLPDTTWQDAILLAERVRAAFEATCHTVAEQPFTATVSVGVATSEDARFDLSALLIAADQALYRAKALGRNRVELSTHSPQAPSARRASGQAAA